MGILSVLFIYSCTSDSSQNKEYDVVVYGGNSAGVMAAYTAKMQGKSVILIEPGKHLGGLSSGGLGRTDIGNKYAVTGLALDFYRKIGKYYGKLEQWIFEPHVAEDIFNEYVKKAGFEVLYQNRIIAVSKDNGTITEITVEKPSSKRESAKTSIKGKMFIDCSYEGDLMAKAGVSYTVGREANSAYHETHNGVQLGETHQFMDGIDPYKITGDPKSGLVWGVSPDTLAPRGTGDHRVQAYNFRVCLTRDPKNRIAITKPDNYDASRYELLLRYLAKFPKEMEDKKTPQWPALGFELVPNQKTDINNGHSAMSTDMIGMNYDYPEASYEKREKIIKAHEDYTKGMLFFLSQDPRIAKNIRDTMQLWGYPKDEYQDNGNWSPQLYVREARRMVSDYVMTQANCEGKKVAEDGIGMAAYTMDSHHSQRVVVNGMVKNEGDLMVVGFPPYPISYRSIVPKASECKNLIVPVCLSASHIAYGSIRMEPVFMVLGQSAGLAAALAIDGKVAIQALDVRKLQQVLKDYPLADNRPAAEMIIDNEDKNDVRLQGSWAVHKNGTFGPSCLTDSLHNEVKSVRFIPNLPNSGATSVYAYFPKLKNASNQTIVTVFNGKVKKEIVIKLDEIVVLGQDSGDWVPLGTFDMKKGRGNYVEISNKHADGIVVADAILFKY
ncbi:FAD-dependent oxidoreductase [Pedobacter sp. MC2016-14]|uniref:FAD-dependent oxidoreductase n=1 Tax=Pedobacter sp. MC2016-14 TaxID=2897327 RepID=UPI001E3C9B46|nr:FAD-dependent oxidoreductase [Pedobacter sp. MC2016-14]MCD0490335.1 FAD-dependent oxidoreductase [Pedobacter sp. MC2016-14]